MNRRSLILGGAALIAAPAVVRAESLMKIVVPKPALIPWSEVPLTVRELRLRKIESDLIIKMLYMPAIELPDGGYEIMDSAPVLAQWREVRRQIEELRA